MHKIKLCLGNELATEVTLGKDDNTYNIHYMGEILRITSIGNVVNLDLSGWFKSMRDRLKL